MSATSAARAPVISVHHAFQVSVFPSLTGTAIASIGSSLCRCASDAMPFPDMLPGPRRRLASVEGDRLDRRGSDASLVTVDRDRARLIGTRVPHAGLDVAVVAANVRELDAVADHVEERSRGRPRAAAKRGDL